MEVYLVRRYTQFTGSGDPWLNVTEDRIIQAVYKPSNIVVPDGNAEYTLTIKNGTANGKTEPITAKGGDDRILVAAESRTDGSQFTYWTVEPASYANLLVDGVSTASTTFIMPNENVTLTANFSGGSGGNTPKPDGKYTVTVVNGRGGGQFAPGTTVTITANTPECRRFLCKLDNSDSRSYACQCKIRSDNICDAFLECNCDGKL